MFKAYFLSALVGTISLSPLSALVLPSKHAVHSKSNTLTRLSAGGGTKVTEQSIQNLNQSGSIKSSFQTTNNLRTETQAQPTVPETTKTTKEVISRKQKPLEKPDLKSWLGSISPLFKNGGIDKSVTIISRWNGSYFVILQWDSKHKVFRKLGDEYGIWSNKVGNFTIGLKNSKEDTKQQEVKRGMNQCKDLYDLWHQNWHTYWWFSRWIRSFKVGENHDAISNCYKDPVIFLESGIIIPLFDSEKNNRWDSQKILNRKRVFWDHDNKTFVNNVESGNNLNLSIVDNYGDWNRLFNIK